MASEILTELNYSPDTKGKEQALSYYNNFKSRFSDYVFTKDDLIFLNNNFEFYGLGQRGKLFAYPPTSIVTGKHIVRKSTLKIIIIW